MRRFWEIPNLVFREGLGRTVSPKSSLKIIFREGLGQTVRGSQVSRRFAKPTTRV
jgi:hypothetical protein